MANELLALARPQLTGTPPADYYEAFYDLLAASERGRAFLAEHARRGRIADTEVLLAALARIEATVRNNAVSQGNVARAEMQMLVLTIRGARPQIEASGSPERAAKLSALVDLLEERIAALAGPLPAMLETTASDLRPRLAVVPPPEQPELPIPSPAAAPAPIALAAPPVTEPEPAPPTPPIQQAAAADIDERPAEPEAQAPTPLAPPDNAKLWALSDTKLAPPPFDPLAAIMMLSEDERIALFT
jgi:hypothetical protein